MWSLSNSVGVLDFINQAYVKSFVASATTGDQSPSPQYLEHMTEGQIQQLVDLVRHIQIASEGMFTPF